MEVDVTAALAYLERVRAESGERVTITHVVGAALGRAIREVPEIRARIVMGRLVDLDTCDIGFAVDIEQGSDLAPVKVLGRRPAEPARGGPRRGRPAPAGSAPTRTSPTAAARASCGWAPSWAMRPALGFASLVAGGLGRSALGQPGFPLGTAFVSNVGSLGLDEAFLAPLPFARTPVYLAVGAIQSKRGRRGR